MIYDCVTYVGSVGAGHFVTMVHNGIEEGVLQLIAEVYDLLPPALGLTAAEIANLFAERSRGPMEAYLFEIAPQVLAVRVPIPTMAAAIDARVLSNMKAERVAAGVQITSGTTPRVAGDAPDLVAAVRDALGAGAVCSYA